jgi:hypothetical protein
MFEERVRVRCPVEQVNVSIENAQHTYLLFRRVTRIGRSDESAPIQAAADGTWPLENTHPGMQEAMERQWLP